MKQLEDFIDAEIARHDPKDKKEPPFATTEMQDLYSDMCYGLGQYQAAAAMDVDRKVLYLKMISTACLRYLEATRKVKGEFVGRIAAAIELYKQVRAEMKVLRPLGNTAAKSNWLKLMPKVKASQNWNNLKKIHVSQGGKKLGEHYWKEIFDPYHRPPHAVNDYDRLFNQWLDIASPWEDEAGTIPNPNHDPNFRQNFFNYLDSHGHLPLAHFHYKYLSRAERDSARIIARAGLLIRKQGGQPFSTAGMELNNGLRIADMRTLTAKQYEGSNQSMIRDHAIWVMSPGGDIYSGPQTTLTGDRHHSAFLSGAPVKGGGEWLVEQGTLKVITGSSGHYAPNFAHFQEVLRTLAAYGIDLSKVAAEWAYRDDLRYFNAKQLSQSNVKAEWNGWPKFDGRPLRPILPLNPTSLSSTGIPVDVTGTPYDDRYLTPPRQPLKQIWRPPGSPSTV